MIADIEPIEQIVFQAQQISPPQRLRLIQRITETLLPAFSHSSTPLQYGKYQGEQMSTLYCVQNGKRSFLAPGGSVNRRVMDSARAV